MQLARCEEINFAASDSVAASGCDEFDDLYVCIYVCMYNFAVRDPFVATGDDEYDFQRGQGLKYRQIGDCFLSFTGGRLFLLLDCA
jgi:hypothetical protein